MDFLYLSLVGELVELRSINLLWVSEHSDSEGDEDNDEEDWLNTIFGFLIWAVFMRKNLVFFFSAKYYRISYFSN